MATPLEEKIHNFIQESFFESSDTHIERKSLEPWKKLTSLSTRLWLDTGSITNANQLWTEQFSALTTNNTLLNREVQTGAYDNLIAKANTLFSEFPDLTEKERILELAFILNAVHGLRLVDIFDAYVSVEEHTDLANDLDKAVDCALRFHDICPEKFIIKLPFTPAGLLAARKIVAKGITVNHTLGFSARQNYIMARVAKTAYVNVFLGRLGAFVTNNNLGDGTFIGEKAALASQTIIKNLRDGNICQTLQIAASFRNGTQVADLAGIDVMTIPPKVAQQFLDLNLSPKQISDKTHEQYTPALYDKFNPDSVNLNTLWDVPDELVACIDKLENEDIDAFSADDLVNFFHQHNCSDIFYRFNDKQINTSREEGKIPLLKNWYPLLENKTLGLDTLMNLAGLNSFIADQADMDDKIKTVLQK